MSLTTTRALTRSTEQAPQRGSAWKILRYRDFRFYFTGSVVSNLGTWLQNTAQILVAYHLTHSVFAIGLVTCVQFSGFFLLGPWAAVVASRIGGRRLLIGTQVLSAATAAGMAWLEASGHLDEPLLIAGAFVLGIAFTFALPIQTALVPRLVDEADTEAAMTMNSVSYNAGRAVAPAVCVAVIITLGFGWAFAFNAVSFLVFAAVLAEIHPHPARDCPPPSATPAENSAQVTENSAAQVARYRDGLVEALKRPRIVLILAMVAAVTLADDPILVLGPGVAHHLPGASNDWAGFFLSALGCGTILGSLVPTRHPPRSESEPSVFAQKTAARLMLLAGCVILFALGISKWVSLAAAFGTGIAALRAGALTQTYLARENQRFPQATASIMTLWAMAWAGTKPLASLLDGWLASTHGIRFAAFALVSVAVALALIERFLTTEHKQHIKKWSRTLGDEWGSRIAVAELRLSIPSGLSRGTVRAGLSGPSQLGPSELQQREEIKREPAEEFISAEQIVTPDANFDYCVQCYSPA
jgi:MFS family permease